MKILIIEDEELLAGSVRALLKSRGFEADTVQDGETGVEYALLEAIAAAPLPREHPEGRLRQMLEVLLDNAVKYSSPQGRVTFTLERQGRHCRLAVSNTGQAIPAGELSRIFQRFYRVDKVRSMSAGYGLGLPIARQILQEHGGKIWAESEGGVNTFIAQLPQKTGTARP